MQEIMQFKTHFSSFIEFVLYFQAPMCSFLTTSIFRTPGSKYTETCVHHSLLFFIFDHLCASLQAIHYFIFLLFYLSLDIQIPCVFLTCLFLLNTVILRTATLCHGLHSLVSLQGVSFYMSILEFISLCYCCQTSESFNLYYYE